MSRPATIFLLIVAPALAIMVSVLGLETLHSNLLGWFLLFTGITYSAGIVIDAYIRKQEFWMSKQGGEFLRQERGDRSFWPIALGIMIVFFLSPLEYLFFAAFHLFDVWMEFIGLVLVLLGSFLFVWARRMLGRNYSGHISAKKDQILVQSGPYHIIRHPAYAGYLLMGLGVALGYSSLFGLAALIFIFLPALVYRIHVEDRLLAEYFGAQFDAYARKKKRILPGVW